MTKQEKNKLLTLIGPMRHISMEMIIKMNKQVEFKENKKYLHVPCSITAVRNMMWWSAP